MSGVTATEERPAEHPPAATPGLGRPISKAVAIGVVVASALAAALGIAVVRTDPGPEPALVAPGIPTADDDEAVATADPEVVALGEAYLVATPDEADRATLLQLLGIADDAVGDLNAQLDAFDQQIASEQSTGQTVVVDGEEVAVTEARLAALIALQERDEAVAS
jgi:hypothetical protein